jgi:acetyl-CoA decarbonylase/synthase complex subunit delta
MVKLEDITKLLEKYDVVELSGVNIDGDVEIEFPSGGGGEAALQFAVGQGAAQIADLLSNIARSFGVQVSVPTVPAAVPAAEKPKIEELITSKFEVGKGKFVNQIQEVTIGATSSDGGTRDNTVTIGGERVPPFYTFAEPIPHPVAVTVDCFDMPISLAKAVRMHYEDVMEDPGEWAKKNVKEFGADMVTIHLISTDPYIKDTPAKEAAKTVEEVLQAVKVPIVIGGSGNPDKDPEVLEAAAEAAEGERCLIASANLGMDYARIANAANKYGHVILSWTQLSVPDQKTLNKHLFGLGTKREDIVMDPTTAALGYGLDYAFTNIERMRLLALKGDIDLTFPISCGVTNAWGAREAWMKESPLADDSSWGPREYRGPLYEIITGYVLCLAGADMMMMMHPGAAAIVKELTRSLMGLIEEKEICFEDWLKSEV